MNDVVSWYEGLPDVTVEITCGDEKHSVVWCNGEIVLRDHDLESERALVALGSEHCECMRAAEGWAQRLEMSQIVTAFTGLERLRSVTETNISQLSLLIQSLTSSGLGSRASSIYSDLGMNHSMLALLSLGEEIVLRAIGDYVAARDASWRTEGTLSDSEVMRLAGMLSDVVNPALDESMRTWRRLDAGTSLTVESWLGHPGENPSIFGWMSGHGGFAAATTGLDWITEILIEGIHIVDGCFVLRRSKTASDRSWHEVFAVRWEPQWHSTDASGSGHAPADRIDRHFADRWTPRVAPARIFRSGEGWHLSWL